MITFNIIPINLYASYVTNSFPKTEETVSDKLSCLSLF